MQQWLEMVEGWRASLAEHLPQLLAALIWVAVGWIVARVVGIVARRVIASALGSLARRPSVRDAMDSTGVLAAAPRYTSIVLFWAVWIFFVAAAAETLGLPVVTGSLNRFVYYLPNVLAAVLIVLSGLVVGKLASSLVGAAAERVGVARSPMVGGATQLAIVLLSLIVGLEQLGVDGDVLVIMFAVTSGVLLATGGLAFGLGARLAVGNLVARHYVGLAYHPGHVVRIDGVEGTIVGLTPTSVVIESEVGRVSMPAQRFLEVMSVLVPAVREGSDGRDDA